MAWGYITGGTAGNASGTTLAVTRPSTAANAWFFLDLYLETNTIQTPTFNNGTWTLVKQATQTGSTPDYTHYRWRSLYNAEGASFTISWDASSIWRTAIISAYSGGDATSVQDGTPTSHNSAASQTTVDIDSITTAQNNSLVYYSQSNFDNRAATPATGTTPTFTERTEFANFSAGDGILATAGATGNKTVTLDVASWNIGMLSDLALTSGAAQDTPELYGRPSGRRGQNQLHQLLAQ